MAKKNNARIGGQAVLEGVMMRGKNVSATAVRDPSGTIQIESSRFTPLSEKSVFFRIPIIRGVLSFAINMVGGMNTLMRASEVYGDLGETEPSKFEKWLSEKFKIDIMNIVVFIGLLLGVGLSILLFVFIPNWATDGVYKLISLDGIKSELGRNIIKNLTSGAIRIAVFVGYLAAVSLMKDIKRVFRYHGAEHKTISCYEKGLPLTVENAQKMSTIHDRCGTTFMFVVMVISILFFSFFGWQSLPIRLLIRIAGIPIVAGISYEILMFLAKFDNPFVRILKAPGLLLQKLTTKEPDDSMVEVAITAFTTVLNMMEDESIPETKFITFVSLNKAKETLNRIKELNDNEFDLIMMHVSQTKTRTELLNCRLNNKQLDLAIEIVKKYKENMPLQYAMGVTCFYGFDIKVDKRVLIPRPETELLAEQTILFAKKYENPSIIELCCGSGAVAIAISKTLNVKVTASDISKEALDAAKGNITLNNADVTLIESNLFDKISGKYDIIVINPPYIPSLEIPKLDSSVKDYEPHLALDGGTSGLDFYLNIAKDYKEYLNEGGAMFLEVGIHQAQNVSAMFSDSRIIRDYNDIERIVVVSLPKSITTEDNA